MKALLFQQYETIFPRILEMVCDGYDVKKALKELPIPVDTGAFMSWIRKDAERHEMLKLAKEVRTEVWIGEMVAHATGEKLAELDRSKVVIELYKWLISRENKKEYGDNKTVDINSNVSITVALQQANERVIEAQLVDDTDLLDDTTFQQLRSAEPDDSDDDDA